MFIYIALTFAIFRVFRNVPFCRDLLTSLLKVLILLSQSVVKFELNFVGAGRYVWVQIIEQTTVPAHVLSY